MKTILFTCLFLLVAIAVKAQVPRTETAVKASIVQLDQEEPVNWGFAVFTDSTGQHKITAMPLAVIDGNVNLKTRDEHSLTVALSKFSKEDRDLLSKTFEYTGIENWQSDIRKLREAIPKDTTTIRAKIIREEREAEFVKKYEGKKFDLRFNITDIADSDVKNSDQYVVALEPRSDGICLDIVRHTQSGVRGILVKLNGEDAKKVAKGNTLHIVGNITLGRNAFGEDDGGLPDHSHQQHLYWFSRQGQRDLGRTFWMAEPTITIEQGKISSLLKRAVAAKVAKEPNQKPTKQVPQGQKQAQGGGVL